MPDGLHVVVIFHGVDKLLHHSSLLFALQLLIVLGDHLDLGGDESILAQARDNIVEVIGQRVDGFGC